MHADALKSKKTNIESMDSFCLSPTSAHTFAWTLNKNKVIECVVINTTKALLILNICNKNTAIIILMPMLPFDLVKPLLSGIDRGI